MIPYQTGDRPADIKQNEDSCAEPGKSVCFGPGTIEWRRGKYLVRLEEEFRKCAVLIGTAAVGSDYEISPWGTAFLVEYDGVSYLVTAQHVVSGNADAPFDVRFNKHTGGAENYHIDDPDWVFHPTDNTVDVAVHEIEVPEWADCSLVQKVTITEDRRFRSKNLGPGNRTYTVGLWRLLIGDRRNQPFVYSGHIGLIPEDQKIPLKPWLMEHGDRPVEANVYLVEGQQLQGASGAPVFVRRTIQHPLVLSKSKKLKAYVEGSIWLLGIQTDIWTEEIGYDSRGGKIVVPRGVSAVVPSMKLSEVLEHPELNRKREQNKQAKQNADLPEKYDYASGRAVDERRDAALKAALGAPPKPRKKPGGDAEG